MIEKSKPFLHQYIKIFLPFVFTFSAIRLYDYYVIATRSFVQNGYIFEVYGLLFDLFTCLIYSSIFIIPIALFSLLNQRIALIIFHSFNILLLVIQLALIITFSERNTPFDHELFTRSTAESWLTTKQMMTSGFYIYLPFIFYISLYFFSYKKFFKQIIITKTIVLLFVFGSLLATVFISFSNPAASRFKQMAAYYITCNKLNYFVMDSYHYFNKKNNFVPNVLTEAERAAAVTFYQSNQPFSFTSTTYPLLHKDVESDVLGSFFNLNKTNPPNIVVLVVEGLSADFSGENAYATSFTPFLDSLSKHSLRWDNFLSTAPGTFAAHPAISGSLPYGKRGFSSISVMPDHLSLIKICKANNYHTKFLIGFNPDFDNMGGYIRLQGTDMILSKYPDKYKEMGMGAEGWSMGYPDDALFSRSFEVIDSLPQQPYLNIYHTATTHMPYLFEQKPLYEKLFDKKITTIQTTPSIKKILKETKKVLITYMFADDCFRTFFKQYSKRKDYSNTIFFITGDHHIGSFPSTGSIDDYHVPLIVFSPMLKAAKKFLSVNSHNNLTPTISALLFKNYKQLLYHPKEVHWVGNVMDTFAGFRNIHAMPFMAWSREMNDYIWKDYFLSNDQLYKLTPQLLQEPILNDSVKNYMTKLLNNYILINDLVCNNNKVFPADKLLPNGQKKLLFQFSTLPTQNIQTNSADTSLMPEFKIPTGYKYLYLEVNAAVKLLSKGLDDQPSFRFALVDTSNYGRNYVFYTNHNIVEIANGGDFVEEEFNNVSTNDMITLDDYKKNKQLIVDLAFYSQKPIQLQMKNLQFKVYGVK